LIQAHRLIHALAVGAIFSNVTHIVLRARKPSQPLSRLLHSL
jgi:hypothetical protein